MGNELTYYGGKRAQEAKNYGSIYLQLNQDAVLPDDTVTGSIYIHLHQSYPGDKVCLKIKGREHTKWIDKETRYRSRPDGTQEAYQVDVPREAQVEVLKQISDVYDWRQGAVIPPGQYSFPLSFRIPNGLPGSFFLRNGTAVAEIGYEIQAFLVPEAAFCPKIKFKRPLTVRQNLSNLIQTREISTTKNISTCCCCSQGSVSMKTYFEKTAYAPSEVARVVTEVDNSKCQVAVQDLSFQFLQNVTLHAQGHSKHFTFVIRSMSLGRIEPGQAFVDQNRKEASIQLPAGQSGRMKDHRGETIEHYDMDVTQALTPSTHGRLVSSEFSLRVTSAMEGCICCDSFPSNDLPVQVYAVVQKTIPPPIPPVNWNPQPMPAVVIAVNVGSPIIINVNNGGSVPMNNQAPMQSQSARVQPLPQQPVTMGMNNNINYPAHVDMNTSCNSTVPMIQPYNMTMNMSPDSTQRGYGMPNNNANMNMGMYSSGQTMNNGMPNNNANMNMGMYSSSPTMNNGMPNNNMSFGMRGMDNNMSSYNPNANMNMNNNMPNNNMSFGMRGMDNSMPSHNSNTNMNKSSNDSKPKTNNGFKVNNVVMEADPNTHVNTITKMDVSYGMDVPNPLGKYTGNKTMHLNLNLTLNGNPPPKNDPVPNRNLNPNLNAGGPTPTITKVVPNNNTDMNMNMGTNVADPMMTNTMPNTNINMNMGTNNPNPTINNDTNNGQGMFQMPQNYNVKSTSSETYTQNGMTVTETQSYNQTGGPQMIQPQQGMVGQMDMGMNNNNQMMNNDTSNGQGMFQMPQNYNATSTYSENQTQNGMNAFESQSYNQNGGTQMMDMNMNMGMNAPNPMMDNGMSNMNMNMGMNAPNPIMDSGMNNYYNDMNNGMQDAYQAPQDSYQAPQESYQAPQESYQASQESYQAPQDSYQAPQESYQAPQESYQAPQEAYQEPPQIYDEPAPQQYQVQYEDE